MDELITDDNFNRYRILERISTGKVSFVYRGVHASLGKPVALKVLHPQFVHDARVRERFLREGRAVARVRHPHVVDVSDVGSQDGVPYIVMEFLEGESLASMLEREGPCEVREAVDILIPVADALRAVHAAGVLHRDLRPANILLVRTGVGEVRPTLVDFGIARVIDNQDGGLTQVSSVLGDPAYMAPEVALDARCAGPRSDQFSLGATLYEMVTGHPPIEGGTAAEQLRRARESAFDPPRAIVPTLPEVIEAVILRAMSRRAPMRFNTLDELIDALLPLASERTRVVWGASPFDPIAPLSNTPPPRRTSSSSVSRLGRGTAPASGTSVRRHEVSETPVDTRVSLAPAPPKQRASQVPPSATARDPLSPESPELLAAFEPSVSVVPRRHVVGVPGALLVLLVAAVAALALVHRQTGSELGRAPESRGAEPAEQPAPDAATNESLSGSHQATAVDVTPPPAVPTGVVLPAGPALPAAPSVAPQIAESALLPPALAGNPREQRRSQARAPVRRAVRALPRPGCVNSNAVAVPLFEVDPSAGTLPVRRRGCP